MNPPSDPSPAKAPTGAAREALCDCGRIEHGRHHSACPAFAEPYKRASPAKAADVTDATKPVRWKDDVVREIVTEAARVYQCGEVIDSDAVYAILDQWAPLTVDEAEREMDSMTDAPPMTPAEVEATVAFVARRPAEIRAAALPSPAPEGGRDAATAKPTNPNQFSSPRDEPVEFAPAEIDRMTVETFAPAADRVMLKREDGTPSGMWLVRPAVPAAPKLDPNRQWEDDVENRAAVPAAGSLNGCHWASSDHVRQALARLDNWRRSMTGGPTLVMLEALRFDLLAALGLPMDHLSTREAAACRAGAEAIEREKEANARKAARDAGENAALRNHPDTSNPYPEGSSLYCEFQNEYWAVRSHRERVAVLRAVFGVEHRDDIPPGDHDAGKLVDALARRVGDAETMLADIEWNGDAHDRDGDHVPCCPQCGGIEGDGHHPSCKLAALLSPAGDVKGVEDAK